MPQYISGSQATFQSRLHECIQSGADITGVLPSFKIESGNYTGAPVSLVNTWIREINKKLYIISGIPSNNG